MIRTGFVSLVNILAAIDGSSHSKKALEFACRFARMYDARLIVMHVIHESPGSDTWVLGGAAVTVEASQEKLEEAAAGLMSAALEIAAEAGCDDVETVVRGGYPAQQILQYAKKRPVDIIVMGSRGLSDLKGLLLGSVSHKINNLAECTCITVR